MTRQRVTQAKWDAARAEVKEQAAKDVEANAKAAKAAKAEFLKRNANGALDKANAAAEVDTEPGYGDWTKAELSAELENRGLPHTGNKDELVAALEESDASE